MRVTNHIAQPSFMQLGHWCAEAFILNGVVVAACRSIVGTPDAQLIVYNKTTSSLL
jgi:hypothetical protein